MFFFVFVTEKVLKRSSFIAGSEGVIINISFL